MNQIEGLGDIFDDQKVLLDIEFMDSKRFPGVESRERFFQQVSEKIYSLPPYDIVITADDNALDFYLEYRDLLFGDIPLVFFGVNNIEKATALNSDPLITGIVEAVSMTETIQVMIDLLPGAGKIAAIIDGKPSGMADYRYFMSLQSEFPDYLFTSIDLRELSWKELEYTLSGFGSDTAVLLLSAYIDKNGKPLLFEESLDLVTDNLNQPLFHLWSYGLGNGILGGKLISMREQGRAAAELAIRVMEGAPPSELEIRNKSGNHYMFDYKQMKRFGIRSKELPLGSTIINAPYSFYTENRTLVHVVSVSFLFLLILLIILAENVHEKHKSEAKYRSLFYDTNSVMLIIRYEDGAIIEANEAAVSYYGYSYEELTKLNISDVNTASNTKIRHSMDIVRKGKADVLAFKHRLSNGNVRDVEVYSSPVNIQGMNYLHSIVHDVTEKMQYQAELNEARKKAESALKIKNDFLANVSHELRTPLNGVIGMLNLISDVGFNKKSKQWYEMAVISANNLRVVIEDLLDFTQLGKGGFTINKFFFSIEEFLDLSAGAYLSTAKNKGLQIVQKKAFSHKYFFGDETRISQIVGNLVSNAVKYSENGNIVIDAAEEARNLVIKISDEGMGIPKDCIEEIFEPFHQLEDTMTKTHGGMGLGLSIAKDLTEQLGAELTVHSIPGSGTTFTFVVPGEFSDIAGSEN